MQEQKKREEKKDAKAGSTLTSATQSAAPNAADVLQKLEGKVKVLHGANDEELELVGQTVQAVRASLVDSFNIPGDAMALVNGDQVDNNYVLKQNDVLEFIKAAGVKGKILPI